MSMKIVAGIGSIDDYLAYAEAGADELFCGYVPADYMMQYGRQYPVNRREVIYYNVQIGSESELMIMRKMIEKAKVPVSIALNGLFYGENHRKAVVDIARKCIALGYTDFIAAESELIDELKSLDKARITVSGELGELNAGVLEHVCGKNVRRVIFPRQTTIQEMRELIDAGKTVECTEYEAFVLNEKCHFTGAYCNSLHCDELCHICKIPYALVDKCDNMVAKDEGFSEKREDECLDECNGEWASECDDKSNGIGATGCAVCLLWQLREAGVTHLKVVSRGNSSEATCEDIRMLRRALDILESSSDEREYLARVFKEIFPKGCNKNCYTRRYSNEMN